MIGQTLFALVLLAGATLAPEAEWARFRGPNGAGVANVTGLPVEFSPLRNVVWKLELPPGAWSSQRHWHERQDEFVYVVEGEVTLVTNEGDTVLTAGMVAGFRAGEANGHHLTNRSNAVARVLEVGTRTTEETAHYPDIAMMYREGEGYLTANGRPLK